jgi:hypothetical protein
MDLVSWDVHAVYELPYDSRVEEFRKQIQQVSRLPGGHRALRRLGFNQRLTYKEDAATLTGVYGSGAGLYVAQPSALEFTRRRRRSTRPASATTRGHRLTRVAIRWLRGSLVATHGSIMAHDPSLRRPSAGRLRQATNGLICPFPRRELFRVSGTRCHSVPRVPTRPTHRNAAVA